MCAFGVGGGGGAGGGVRMCVLVDRLRYFQRITKKNYKKELHAVTYTNLFDPNAQETHGDD